MSATTGPLTDEQVIERWRTAWPKALAAWSRYTRLRDPRLCESTVEAAREGLGQSFAMIRLADQRVVIDLEAVRALNLSGYAVEILAHEIGHHVLAPATATDHFRLLARIRRALPTLERHAPMVANLYTDLLINDRLQRQGGLRMAEIYKRLVPPLEPGTPQKKSQGGVWALYMRIYEHLWQLERGSLTGADVDSRVDTDAWLGARVIRVYANDWLKAAGRFAALLLPYLVNEEKQSPALERLHDTKSAAEGAEPSGAQDVEADEIDGAIHPAEDPAVTGLDEAADEAEASKGASSRSAGGGAGQTREPYEYGEILKAAGIKLDDHEIAVRYYRERALPHLIAFPSRVAPQSQELQMEGLEPWEAGDPLDELDGFQSVLQSPRMIPGVSTVRRQYGPDAGREPERLPIDLDLYVDSSGSMPNPQRNVSYLTLAGAIIALSALRAGSAVQATLWSGKGQVTHTPGFVRTENDILRVLTGFYGGATAFPIHRLRETYEARPRSARPVHLLMISDDGVTTMFDADEQGNSGWDVAARALRVGGAGGTMALNLPVEWERADGGWDVAAYQALRRARTGQGWEIFAIAQFEDLLAFAREFSRRHYASERTSAMRIPA
jgi:hypothetical protein